MPGSPKVPLMRGSPNRVLEPVSMQRSSKMGPRHQQAVKVIQKIACLVPFTASLAGVAIAVLNADFAISLTNQNCSNDEKPGKSSKEKSGSQ